MSGAANSALRGGQTPRPVEVSIVLPCFNSQRTLVGCLDALRKQSFTRFEIVMVDSSPGRECEAIVRERFPEVRYQHPPRRLLPHAARNRGTEEAVGELLVFTDPDTYARPDWLERLVAHHRATSHIIVGALACFGRRWIDLGNHLCKFSKWLPGGAPRAVDNAPTANLLCPRAVFDRVGSFDGDNLHGDTTFSWKAREQGNVLWFAPDAIVFHHHLQGVGDLLRERHSRGVLFGELRADLWSNRRPTLLLYLLVSLLPVRLLRVLALTAAHCRRARCLIDLVATHPLVVLGHEAALLGESRAYARRLVARRPRGGT
jgi:GT2 family glycosyltransferase